VPRVKSSGRFGWQGASLVAITYVYFLIFAQFSFLKRLAILGIADAHLKTVMAAMAAGGIALSLLAPRLRLWPAASLRMRIALGACAAVAWLAILPLGFFAALTESFLIGAGLGLLTVTLVTHLRQWAGNRDPLLAVGAGTGVGYLICNLPALFTARAEVQAMTAGILCLVGIGITLLPAPLLAEPRASQPQSHLSFYRVLGGFTALVWLDSAAFFIIQNNPALKAGTWQGSAHLWTNGFLHLAAALASAWLLRRKGLSPALTVAYLALGIACLLLLDPGRALIASALYPIGVSLYSVALVAYPSLLAPTASIGERGRMAGWIYAIAGWTGSAMGIGMGQNLGHIPPAFVAAAGVALLLPLFPGLLRSRVRELSLTGLILLMALYLDRTLNAIDRSPQLSQVERGRQVYISEGCIHCHSQYVRPNSPDVLMWGPVESIDEIRLQQPPLIGNRRQGPDLSEVGGRRSALWLKAHFFNPAQVSGASIMPSYGFLFSDQRGDDLVAYLESLRGTATAQHLALEKFWQPSAAATAQANASDGALLYLRDCANCHSMEGPTRRAWQVRFKQLPGNLAAGPYLYLSPTDTREERLIRLAQIVKFGIPSTDMPGHEYLSDRDVASITLWLSQIIAQSEPANTPH
jgi:cytochrome c oxidase cbb3-type subunit 2